MTAVGMMVSAMATRLGLPDAAMTVTSPWQRFPRTG
jgi:hypothetical protein